jgi:uncharacterized protein YoxC
LFKRKIKNRLSTAGSSMKEGAGKAKDAATHKKYKTKDETFKQIHKNFTEQMKHMQALSKDITSYLAEANGLIEAQKKLAQDLLGLAPKGSQMEQLCQLQIQCCDEMIKQKKEKLNDSLRKNFTDPLNNYMGQYREVEDRIRERGRRESEMDKLSHQLVKQKEKNSTLVQATETKLENATENYNVLNKELQEDIPKLIQDTSRYFHPLILQLILTQSTFWNIMATEVYNMSQKVDSSQATVPQIIEVITPKNQSSAHRKSAGHSYDPYSFDASAGKDPYASPPGGQNPYGSPPGGSSGVIPTVNPNQSYASPPGANSALPPLPPHVPPTMTAQAQWDFVATSNQELSFRKGDVITILDNSQDWWKGELHGKVGLLPGNYVKLL